MSFTLPEGCKIVEAIAPKTDAAGTTGDYISCKYAHRVYVVIHLTQGAANTVAYGLNEATAVLPSGAAAVTATFPIWSNLDCAASDTLVRQTDAATYTTDAGQKHKQVIFEWDPAKFSSGCDCLAVTSGASNAGNIVEAMYYIASRYPGDQPPAAITD